MQSILKASLVVAAALLLGSTAASASTIEVKVPFPFMVHGQRLPAGQYRLDREGPVMRITGEHGNTSAMVVLTEPAAGDDPAGRVPALTFHRHEKDYRLDEVWIGSRDGYDIARR